MDLSVINSRLTERRIAKLADAVANIEAGIDAGEVANKIFVDGKDMINRAIEEGAEAFLATGPRDQKHPQSDWWLAAYHNDAFVRGAHGVPVALKRAQKAGMTDYANFISAALLPLNDLLQSAKPLIVKRGDKPKTVSPKQAAKLARSMTCQCCDRPIFAETGMIAHHGYQRPGGGWQTASCSGARELPFEVSRDVLGALIENLKAWEGRAVEALANVAAECVPVIVEIPDYQAPRDRFGDRPSKRVEVTRDTFEAARADNAKAFMTYSLASFDAVKERDVAARAREIEGVRSEITAQQARFNGWTKTHEWDAAGNKWRAIE